MLLLLLRIAAPAVAERHLSSVPVARLVDIWNACRNKEEKEKLGQVRVVCGEVA